MFIKTSSNFQTESQKYHTVKESSFYKRHGASQEISMIIYQTAMPDDRGITAYICKRYLHALYLYFHHFMFFLICGAIHVHQLSIVIQYRYGLAYLVFLSAHWVHFFSH